MAGEPVQRRLQFVLEHYNKRAIDNVTLNFFGMANEVYTIPTKDGKVVVKNCFKNNTEELVAIEAALLLHLESKGIPCPKLIPTKSGKDYLHYDGHFYLMTNFLEGKTPNWEESLTVDMLKEAVRALAEFHNATSDFEPPFESDRIQALDIERARAWVLDLQAELEADTSGRESVIKMKPVLEGMLELADELSARMAQMDLSPLTKAYIHGDLHCYNLMYGDDGRYNGVFDFDFIREDYRLMDFYWSSRTFLWGYWLQTKYDKEQFNAEFEPDPEVVQELIYQNLRLMVDTYRQSASLSDAELLLLPLFVEVMPLFSVRFFKLSNSEDECLEHWDWFNWKLESRKRTAAQVEKAVKQIVAEG